MEYEQFLDKIHYLKSDFLAGLIADEFGISFVSHGEKKMAMQKKGKSTVFV